MTRRLSMIRKIKDPDRWRTGFALFGAELDDGYFVFWRRFHFRMYRNGHQEACRYGMIEEYEAMLKKRKIDRPPPPKPTRPVAANAKQEERWA